MLLVLATPLEAGAVLAGLGREGAQEIRAWTPVEVGAEGARADLVVTGVGKSPAAGAVARLLTQRAYGTVLNLGIAGSLPGGPPLRTAVIATAHAFADEGVGLPGDEADGAFLSLAAMGFEPAGVEKGATPGDSRTIERLRGLLPEAALGAMATVSTCSGRDTLARAVAARTGAIAEGMEGAAVALVARTLGAGYAEVRTISNTTGDRPTQVWDLKGALARLADVVRGR